MQQVECKTTYAEKKGKQYGDNYCLVAKQFKNDFTETRKAKHQVMAVLRKNCNLKAFFHFLHLGNSEILGSKTDLISRGQNINIQKKKYQGNSIFTTNLLIRKARNPYK